MKEEKTIEKLRQEFSFLKKDETPYDKHFDAVVVLCAEGIEVEGENKERIDTAIDILDSTKDQIPLIFMGTIKHIKNLKPYLLKNKIKFPVFYPTKRLHESSWTQVKSLSEYAQKKHFSDILIISHAYHIPRVKRYCAKYMNGTNCSFLPVGDIQDQSSKIGGEIDRIIRYSKKGDLTLDI
jgi:uncharacterized SAM-binding protein YcdF (DUF218 family)